jgi:hypothetical protein
VSLYHLQIEIIFNFLYLFYRMKDWIWYLIILFIIIIIGRLFMNSLYGLYMISQGYTCDKYSSGNFFGTRKRCLKWSK